MRVTWVAMVREILVVSIAASIILIVSKADLAHFAKRAPVVPSRVRLPPAGIDAIVKFQDEPAVNPALGLVLVLRPSCQYCIASKSFCKRLAAYAKRHSILLSIVISEESSTGAFLKDAGLDSFPQYTFTDLNIAVSGTPTLLALNSAGAIKRIWTGALSEQRESDVISLIGDVKSLEQVPTTLPTGEPNIPARYITEFSADRGHVLLDVRERDEFTAGHRDGAVNIPLIELPTRITHELDNRSLTMVDCSHLRSRLCQDAVDRLAEHGFRRVVAVNGLMAESSACRLSEVER